MTRVFRQPPIANMYMFMMIFTNPFLATYNVDSRVNDQLSSSPVDESINDIILNQWFRFIKNKNENIHKMSHTIFSQTNLTQKRFFFLLKSSSSTSIPIAVKENLRENLSIAFKMGFAKKIVFKFISDNDLLIHIN